MTSTSRPASLRSPAATPADAPAPAPAGADPTAGYHFTVVPHTHWDREWYLPFEVFRIRLARMVEEVCDVLEADPRFTSFTLDGQAVILEDVVELRPDLEPRLRALLASGRLVTGPGYVLPDEFLSGPEALIRNLLLGAAVCRRFGGEPMAVGYLPDTFGHVGQLPQVLAGFGLDSFVFWRGLGDEGKRLGAIFRWVAPDGTAVTAIRQLGSYGNANQLGRWEAGGVDLADRPDRHGATAARRFERFLAAWGFEIGQSGIRSLLLCNGSDHERIQAALPDLLATAAEAHPEAGFEIGSYEDYWRRVRPTLRALPAFEGELIGGRDAPVLRGINSARMPLKQAAERSERQLLVAETLAALATLAAAAPASPRAQPPAWRHPRAELERAWREHVRNLPHDSISGCSVDETHRDMAARFTVVERITERIRREALAALAGRQEPWSHVALAAPRVGVVNPLAAARTTVVAIDLPPSLAEVGDLVARDPSDRELPVQVEPFDGGPRRVLVEVQLDGFDSTDVALLPGRPAAVPAAARSVGEDAIENGILRIVGRPDGSIELTDLRSGRTLAGLHRFEDVADRGDEYNFCPLEGDVPVGPAPAGTVRVTASGPVAAELELRCSLQLPEALATDRRSRSGGVAIAITTRVRLVRGSDRVEFVTRLDNRARDHRLRVRFGAPSADDTATVRAEGHFAVSRRPVRPAWGGAGWTEPPQPTSHTAGFVAAGDLAVLGRGLPEYEAVPTRDGLDLALTLLRCVGWLSRDDLATRPGHAGPGLETPEAQCPGTQAFEYAVVIRPEAELDDATLLAESAAYRTPLAVGPAGVRTRGILAVEGAHVTALKGAEDGDGVVLRAFSPLGGPIALAGPAAVQRIRLDETPAEGPPLEPLRPWEIRSLRLAGGATQDRPARG